MSDDLRIKNALMKMLYIDELSAQDIADGVGGEIDGVKSECSVQNIRYYIYTKYKLKKPGRKWENSDILAAMQSLKDLSSGNSFKEDCSKVALATERKLSDIMSKCEDAWKDMYGTIKSIDDMLPRPVVEDNKVAVMSLEDSSVTLSVADESDVTIKLNRGDILEQDEVILKVMPLGQREMNGSITPMEMPDYQTDGAGAVDLCAAEYASIRPGAKAIIKTGLVMKVPDGCVGLILPRSGLAAKQGITILNAPGLVDSDFCGPSDEVKVVLINHATGPAAATVEIKPGDRIAQFILVRVPRIVVEPSVTAFKDDDRGGFGSTGV